jgi:hypothetical protein
MFHITFGNIAIFGEASAYRRACKVQPTSFQPSSYHYFSF